MKDIEKELFPVIHIPFDDRGLLRETKRTSIGIIATTVFKPYKQIIRASHQPRQRIQGSLNKFIHSIINNSKLDLADFHQSLSLDVLDSKKTSESDQLKNKSLSAMDMSF